MIGGDWYEGLFVPPNTLAVVVGDVVGHGLSAAADMALIRGLITALIQDGVAVADVLMRVSRVLQHRPEDVLATAVLVVTDAANGTITYSTAGHPPPVVVQPDGSIMLLDQANAPMLGIGHSQPTPRTVDFAPGARLIMYTDGLVERRDRPYTAGIKELSHILANHPTRLDRHECIDLLIKRLVGDAGTDDIAVVVIDNTTPTTPSPSPQPQPQLRPPDNDSTTSP